MFSIWVHVVVERGATGSRVKLKTFSIYSAPRDLEQIENVFNLTRPLVEIHCQCINPPPSAVPEIGTGPTTVHGASDQIENIFNLHGQSWASTSYTHCILPLPTVHCHFLNLILSQHQTQPLIFFISLLLRPRTNVWSQYHHALPEKV